MAAADEPLLQARQALDSAATAYDNAQRAYEAGVGLLLWAWFWFLTPARSWAEQGGQAMPARMMGLLAVWLVLAALLGEVGGRIVRRRAEHSLRRRM